MNYLTVLGVCVLLFPVLSRSEKKSFASSHSGISGNASSTYSYSEKNRKETFAISNLTSDADYSGKCPEIGIGYYGKSRTIRGYSNIVSWKLCGTLCQTSPDCYAWTWFSHEYGSSSWREYCYLKNDQFEGGRTAEKGVVSGQKECYEAEGPYIAVRKSLSWQEAEHECEEFQAHLVTIRSEGHSKRVLQIAHKFGLDSRSLWLGLSDLKSEGNWEGVDPRYRWTKYRYWAAGEPNGETREKCAEMYYTAQGLYPGLYNDAICGNHNQFVCEKGGMRCNGQDNGCCTKEHPCELGDGDCDFDYECAGSLVCGSDSGGNPDNCPWGDKDDCCMVKPEPPTTTTTTPRPTTVKSTTAPPTTPVSCWLQLRRCLNEGKLTPRECNRRYWECKKTE